MNTYILSDVKEVEEFIEKNNHFTKSFGSSLPFHHLQIPFLWWKHFNSTNGNAFGENRGRNYLGAQSQLNKLYLLIAEDNDVVCGVAPIASYSIKIPGETEALRVLSFAGDPVLIPYQDFLVSPHNRTEVLSLIFPELIKLLKNDNDMIFLGYIPDNSQNVPVIRELISRLRQQGFHSLETTTAQQGGVQPWTINKLISCLKELHEGIDDHHSEHKDAECLIERLQNTTTQKLLFPGTRNTLESKIRDILSKVKDKECLHEQTEKIISLLSPSPIIYPYIKLPSDRKAYQMTLSKGTFRSFSYYNNRFKKQGGFFEKITTEAITDREIDDYINLHLSRWGKESAAFNPSTIAFHKDVYYALANNKNFTLFFANYKGKRIAVHSCFDILSRREAYFTGRDPEYKDTRVGRLLYLETIFDAIDNGFNIYDLGYGGDGYKKSFTKNYATTRNFFLAHNGKIPDLDKIFMGYEYMGLVS